MKQNFDFEKTVSLLKKDERDDEDRDVNDASNKGEKSGGSDGDDEGVDGDDFDFDDSFNDGDDGDNMGSGNEIVAFEAPSDTSDVRVEEMASFYDRMVRSFIFVPIARKFIDSYLPVSEFREIVPSKNLSEKEKEWIKGTVRYYDRKERKRKRSYLVARSVQPTIIAPVNPAITTPIILEADISHIAGLSSAVDKWKRKDGESDPSSPKRATYTTFTERELASLALFVDAPNVDPDQFHEASHFVEEPQRIDVMADIDVDFTWTTSE